MKFPKLARSRRPAAPHSAIPFHSPSPALSEPCSAATAGDGGPKRRLHPPHSPKNRSGGSVSGQGASPPRTCAPPAAAGSSPSTSPSSRLACRGTPPQVLQELGEAFAEFDADGDGKISAEELCRVLESLMGDARDTWREARLMVAELDSDGDGLVDLKDFVGAHVGWCTQEEEEGDLAAAFHVFDRDKDGLISAEELHAIFAVIMQLAPPAEGADSSSSSATAYSLDDCRRMIRGVDRKGTGCVDFDDFKRMMAMTISMTSS